MEDYVYKKEKKRGAVNMKKILAILWAAALCLAFPGCSEGQMNNGTENVEAVVENLFQNLEESEYEELIGPDSGEAASENLVSTELPQWVQERFQEYMTEEGYEDLTGTAFYEISVKACENNWEMSLEHLDVQQVQGDYEISGELKLRGEESEESIGIEGSAQTDEKGQVSYLNISNMAEIAEAIQS